MTSKEKAELLKDTIQFLYCNEGRSIGYINRLLKIDRQTISSFIHENGFIQFNPKKAKLERFVKSHKEFIIARVKDGWPYKRICRELHVGTKFFKEAIVYCPEITEVKKLVSCRTGVEYTEIPGEIWKPVLGYPEYEVSDQGRIRHIAKGLLTPYLNKRHNRFYVSLYNDGKHKNMFLHRIVTHTFCEKPSDDAVTVNHIDGDTHNNRATNLEWCTQRDNNIHSYWVLKRQAKPGKPINFIIEYKGQYKFKTISAFARFIGKSYSQAARWVKENPGKHEIRKILKG